MCLWFIQNSWYYSHLANCTCFNLPRRWQTDTFVGVLDAGAHCWIPLHNLTNRSSGVKVCVENTRYYTWFLELYSVCYQEWNFLVVWDCFRFFFRYRVYLASWKILIHLVGPGSWFFLNVVLGLYLLKKMRLKERSKI